MKTKLNFLSKLVILFLMFASTAFSQGSIINTFSTTGVFTVKDPFTNFLTVVANGQVRIFKTLRLENTTSSSLGIIFKGDDRFLHNYGLDNTFLGINSGNFTMTGNDNTAVGLNSLTSNTTGYKNTAVGSSSLTLNSTGIYNTALGEISLRRNTTGSYNTAVGSGSLLSNTTGKHNTAVGMNSLLDNTTGDNNVALGMQSLIRNETGSYNTAVGYQSLLNNNNGFNNTALGNHSLIINTTGYQNTALGSKSLFFNTNGYNNTAVGDSSLYNNTTGFNNTALGNEAGKTITTGHNLTCIGNNSAPSSGSANHEITLGNSSIQYLRCAVQTITTLSDIRDKKNITDLSLGLDFLMKVKPRLFNWDKREWYENNISDGSKMKEAPTAGFIAQELDEVQTTENAEWLNLVLKENPEKFEATSGNLLPVMVKAIQELKTENDLLKQNNEKLSSEVQSLKSLNGKIVKLEQLVNELSSVKKTSGKKTNQVKTISNEGDQK